MTDVAPGNIVEMRTVDGVRMTMEPFTIDGLRVTPIPVLGGWLYAIRPHQAQVGEPMVVQFVAGPSPVDDVATLVHPNEDDRPAEVTPPRRAIAYPPPWPSGAAFPPTGWFYVPGLRAVRTMTGLSMGDLARLMNWKASDVSSAETLGKAVSKDAIARLAEVLDSTPDRIMRKPTADEEEALRRKARGAL